MKAKHEAGLSIFFPVCNEKENLAVVGKKCAEVLTELVTDPELIIVDDGSTDGSGEIADGLCKEIRFLKVVHHITNKGYGAALQSGFRTATKEFVFYTDGDGQFDVRALIPIFPKIFECDVVSCYREDRQDTWIRKINASIFGLLIDLVFGLGIKDPDCAFKIYRQSVLKNLSMYSTGALIDVEMLLQSKRKGYRIYQTGVAHYPRSAGQSSGADLRVIGRAFFEVYTLSRRIGTRFRRRSL